MRLACFIVPLIITDKVSKFFVPHIRAAAYAQIGVCYHRHDIVRIPFVAEKGKMKTVYIGLSAVPFTSRNQSIAYVLTTHFLSPLFVSLIGDHDSSTSTTYGSR